ncbi:MAG TPA: hypothetical protein VLO09_05855 [Ornithinimicrobium sp.]|nr:hypothetical protein [Ornithinimicrobium sp.]
MSTTTQIPALPPVAELEALAQVPVVLGAPSGARRGSHRSRLSFLSRANRSESANDAAVPPRRIAGRFSLPR